MTAYRLAEDAADWYRDGTSFPFRDNDVFYRDIGSGPVLLAIHGFPTSGCDWSGIAAALAGHFRLIVPDLLDYGRSKNRRRQRFHIRDQADMIATLLASLDIRRVHVLAHDVGDTVAQELLARQADSQSGLHIESLVLMNGGILPSVHRPRPVQKLLLGRCGPLVARALPAAGFGAALADVFGPATRPDEAAQKALWDISLGVNGRSSLARRIHYMVDRRENEARWVGALRDAKMPMLMINGVADPVSGEHLCRAIEQQLPHIDVVRLQNIGHFPLLEAPDECIRHIAAFHRLAIDG